ncbi:MAG: tetratricopeptide repeat protein [Chitinivibrionales bacterium]|nr:tetratricopeptide repeat protein [Chitinivibrionales bacterium]
MLILINIKRLTVVRPRFIPPLVLSLLLCCTHTTDTNTEFSYMTLVSDAIQIARKDIDSTIPGLEDFPVRIEKAAADIKRNFDTATTPEQTAGFFIDRIYLKWGIGFDSNRTDIRSLLPHTILRKKKGSCLGVSLLFLILAEQLDIPLHGVIIPTHFFVRYDNGTTRFNLEPNRKGYVYTDTRYQEKYGLADRPWYDMRNLSGEEVAGAVFFNLANICRLRGNHERAISLYRQSTDRLPGFPEAWGNMGICYAYINRYRDAVDALQQAKEHGPGLENISKNLGMLLLESGKYDEAVEELSEAVQKSPGDPDLHYSIGLGYYYRKDYSKAIRALRRAIKLKPGFREAVELINKINNKSRGNSRS